MDPTVWMVIIVVGLNIGLRLMHHFKIAVGFRTQAVGALITVLSTIEIFTTSNIIPDDGMKIFAALVGMTMLNLRQITTSPVGAKY